MRRIFQHRIPVLNLFPNPEKNTHVFPHTNFNYSKSLPSPLYTKGEKTLLSTQFFPFLRHNVPGISKTSATSLRQCKWVKYSVWPIDLIIFFVYDLAGEMAVYGSSSCFTNQILLLGKHTFHALIIRSWTERLDHLVKGKQRSTFPSFLHLLM
jgi:hypothetical protein